MDGCAIVCEYITNRCLMRMVAHVRFLRGSLVNQNVVVDVDLRKKEVTKSAIIPLFEENKKLGCVSKGCIVGDYCYVVYTTESNVLGGFKNPFQLLRFNLENPTKLEFVCEKKFKKFALLYLFQHDERYLVMIGGVVSTLQMDEFGDYKSTILSIMNIRTRKWRDVKVESPNFDIFGSASGFCLVDGSLYSYGGFVNYSQFDDELRSEFCYFDLFENDKLEKIDENERIEFLMKMLVENTEGLRMFNIRLKKTCISIIIPLMFVKSNL